MSIYPKKFTAIVGLGMTGLSCARYLSEGRKNFAIMDDRAKPPQLEQLRRDKTCRPAQLILGAFSAAVLDDADEIILSPGVSLKHPLIAKQISQGKSVIGDIELFARHVKKPIIAITGSNGKTTVTTLVGLMMQQAGHRAVVCGNIGTPVLSQVGQACDVYVLELSSFQLETTFSLSPTVATILNITPDHMDRYTDLSEYRQAKQRIYERCACPVVNADEPQIWQSVLPSNQSFLSFGLEESADFSVQNIKGQSHLVYRDQLLMPVSELKLQTRHHLQNALASLAICFSADLPLEAMLSVLREFSGIKHRCQWIRQRGGIDYYNDSKGTNVGATMAALSSLGPTVQGDLVLIAGGQGKEADFSPLKALLTQYVKAVVLIGQDADLLEKTFCGITTIKRASNLEAAVQFATDLACAGDAVLLSPACASFDMFAHFEARGDAFINLVEKL